MTKISELSEDDRHALLAALYGEEPEKKKNVHIEPTGFSKTRKVYVGAISYELPTVDYVTRLEMMVTNQAKLINQMQQSISKLENMANKTRKFIRGQTGRITEMQHELDQKIDIRE